MEYKFVTVENMNKIIREMSNLHPYSFYDSGCCSLIEICKKITDGIEKYDSGHIFYFFNEKLGKVERMYLRYVSYFIIDDCKYYVIDCK